MAGRSEIDELIRRSAVLVAEGRRLAAARRGLGTPLRPDERRAALALAGSLAGVVAALKRRVETQGRDFQDRSWRHGACLAYLRVGHMLGSPRR